MCQPLFPKGGFGCGVAEGGLKGDEDNDVIGSAVTDADALHPTLHPWKLRDRWVGLLSPCSVFQWNQTMFHCSDYLQQSGSNKATLGNMCICFSKLLFSYAGGKSLQVKCNHSTAGLCSVLNNNNISLVPGIAYIRLVTLISETQVTELIITNHCFVLFFLFITAISCGAFFAFLAVVKKHGDCNMGLCFLLLTCCLHCSASDLSTSLFICAVAKRISGL